MCRLCNDNNQPYFFNESSANIVNIETAYSVAMDYTGEHPCRKATKSLLSAIRGNYNLDYLIINKLLRAYGKKSGKNKPSKVYSKLFRTKCENIYYWQRIQNDCKAGSVVV